MTIDHPVSELDTKLGFELLEASAKRTVGRIPVEGNRQPYGLLHGGASCLMAETVASLAAGRYGESIGRMPVGTELNATHHRCAREGYATATASALYLGRSSATYEVIITDDAGDRLCTARVTCQLLSQPQ